MKKFALSLILLMSIANIANAIAIAAPSEVPQNVNWSLSIDFGKASEFDSAKIFLNEIEIANIYTLANGSAIVDKFDDTIISNTAIRGTDSIKVFASVYGLKAGNHAIKAVEFRQGTIVVENSQNIAAFAVLSEVYKQQMQTELDNLKELNSVLRGKIEEMNNITQQSNQSLSELKNLLNEMDKNVGTLQEKLNQTEQKDSNFLKELAKFKTGIQTIQGKVEKIETAKSNAENQPITATGFVVLNEIDPAIAGMSLGAISIIAGLYFTSKQQKSIYGWNTSDETEQKIDEMVKEEN